jgi:hypothetical protein
MADTSADKVGIAGELPNQFGGLNKIPDCVEEAVQVNIEIGKIENIYKFVAPI